MTIDGWIVFGVFAVVAGLLAFFFYENSCTSKGRILAIVIPIAVAILLFLLIGMYWFFGNTASGQRMLIDERSELGQGMERVVTVYTADGKILAQYEGKIDLEQNDGGYVKFDLGGKRYIYYNCFVESIADTEK